MPRSKTQFYVLWMAIKKKKQPIQYANIIIYMYSSGAHNSHMPRNQDKYSMKNIGLNKQRTNQIQIS